MILRVTRMPHCPDGMPLPGYATAGAAGLDLRAVWPMGGILSLPAGAMARVPTGIAVEIPLGHAGLVRGRSGLAFGSGVFAFEGTIDADYRGEISVLLANRSDKDAIIRFGDRIAQLVVVPVARLHVMEVAGLGETSRGAGGFGSTGAA